MTSASCGCEAAMASLNLIESKKLLILEVNEVLSRKITHPSQAFSGPKNVFVFKNRNINRLIELRPGIREFLEKMPNNFRIAIWSSTTVLNCVPTMKALFPNQKEFFEFIWFRDRTRLDPDFGLDESIKDFDIVKNLEDIFSNPIFERKWNYSNTIIVDNDPKKLRFNDKTKSVCFVVKSFDETNPTGEGLEELLEFLLDQERK